MDNDLDEKYLLKLIGESLATARRRKSINQDEIGARLNLSRTSISNIERGKQMTPISLIYQYCIEVGKDIHEILPSVNGVSSKKVNTTTIMVDGKPRTVANSVAGFVSNVDKKSQL